MTTRLLLAASCIAAFVSILPTSAKGLEHPRQLNPQTGCELFVGTASGNDPSVRIGLRLCTDGAGAVTGQLQWSSLRSGWNVRDIAGSRTGDRFQLRDLRVRKEQAEPGWRFCMVDEYALTLDEEQLTGRYHSTACDDRATMNLVRSDSPPGERGAPPGVVDERHNRSDMGSQATPRESDSPSNSTSSTGSTDSRSGCNAGGQPVGWFAWLLLCGVWVFRRN